MPFGAAAGGAGASAGRSGPPASAKQVQYLQELLEKAGYGSFRDARRTLGLTQRQSGGKFTVAEASALIDRLVNGERFDPETAPTDDALAAKQASLLKGIPAQLLADELLSRGWSVGEPA